MPLNLGSAGFSIKKGTFPSPWQIAILCHEIYTLDRLVFRYIGYNHSGYNHIFNMDITKKNAQSIGLFILLRVNQNSNLWPADERTMICLMCVPE